MELSVVIYFTIGLIPWLGHAFHARRKPNDQNLGLLGERATVSTAEVKSGRASDWLFVGIIIAIVPAVLAGTIMSSN